ncbi:Hypothetical predicted protein [Olea europaea subsp. europaea]|uniref:Uncharacterized protein n=1 Tax=Olea europaea subsp. europaea TaxID=158383 RepID=A0A8S0U7D1_OLEEU|nr:Hypothetical predicted protein [Olea europaea subsp. europaea]
MKSNEGKLRPISIPNSLKFGHQFSCYLSSHLHNPHFGTHNPAIVYSVDTSDLATPSFQFRQFQIDTLAPSVYNSGTFRLGAFLLTIRQSLLRNYDKRRASIDILMRISSSPIKKSFSRHIGFSVEKDYPNEAFTVKCAYNFQLSLNDHLLLVPPTILRRTRV